MFRHYCCNQQTKPQTIPKLSWNINVSFVSKKATKVLNLLRRHIYTCRFSLKRKAFRTFMIPILDYVIVATVWNPHINKNSIALERIQNCGA